ncbi:unnamed protein product [Brassica rapa subsp. trilocularis]
MTNDAIWKTNCMFNFDGLERAKSKGDYGLAPHVFHSVEDFQV